MGLSDEAKKYRKENRRLIVQASVAGGYFGGLVGLITWMALAKKSPRPTLSTVLIYAGVGLAAVAVTRAWAHRKKKPEQEKPQ